MSISFDREAYYRRIKRLYAGWQKGEGALAGQDVIVWTVGQTDEEQYSKSLSLQLWLFGYELSDTLIGLSKDKMVVVTSKKKAEFLKPITSGKGSENADGAPTVTILIRSKESNADNFNKFYSTLAGDDVSATKFGHFVKDSFEGNFYKEMKKDMKGRQLTLADITGDIGIILAPKEDNEISSMKKASLVTMEIYNKTFKTQLMETIDADRKVKHTKISAHIEEALKDKKKLLGIEPANVESCYPPIIQSGGNYALKYSASSTKDSLHFGTVVALIGIRYKNYCSNTVRTMMVNPTEQQTETYSAVLEAHEAGIDKLRAGVKLADVYTTVRDKLAASKYPKLAEKLGKSIGFAMGIDFRESSLLIATKNTQTAKKGMIFNFYVGVSELKNKEAKDEKGKEYAICIGDTVLVNDADTPGTVLTAGKKKPKNVSIFLKDDSSGSDEEVTANDADPFIGGRGMRNSALSTSKRDHDTAENKRKSHQEKLHDELNREARERLLENKGKEAKVQKRKTNYSYKSASLFPQEPDIKNMRLFMDRKYETIILPFFGIATPFHISTIKNCSSSVEGDYTYLRLNFFVPGTTMGRDAAGSFPESAQNGNFVKETTFRAQMNTSAANNLNSAFRLIRDVQKKFRTREAEAKELDGLVKQEKLIQAANRAAPKLRDLYMRPSISQKRMQGFLEAHTNGFRYTAQRGDKIDILYKNVKHAIFQPCDKEMIMVIHFHLKNGIMVGKKRHIDVQFYIEVGEITTDLGKTGNMRDRDDLYAEQQEREQRHKLKQAFKNFMDKVSNIARDFEFDTPFRDLGFHGVPHRSTCLLQPTSSAIVNVTEWPSFIVSLDEIEFVHFERVSFSLKNFDMVCIYKDYAKKVTTVTSIPMTSLDQIKDWLNSSDIRYTEGIQSLNWAKVLKTVVEDPVGFFEQGGWDFLKQDDDEGDDDDDDEEDETFDAGESGGSGGSDGGSGGSDDSEEDYSSETESSAEEEELGSSEESGKDWDELEAEAIRDDKNKNYDGRDDERGGGHSKKRKHGGDYGGGSKKQRRR